MDRRMFLTTLTGAVALGPTGVLADPIEYMPGLVQKHLDAGDTVFIEFGTTWCSTCNAQRRVLAELKAETPAYEQKVVFISVDWDQHSGSDLARRLKIPRRSTLVVLSGEQELGRIVAQTSKKKIQALMDAALSAV
ncbi:MAG: thioredoxin family protein [Rhodobacteraceae bacterium]|nr:thioredoxin family protein [Paracoccaceae bacterium]